MGNRITVRLSDKSSNWVKELSDKGYSVSDIVRLALEICQTNSDKFQQRLKPKE